MDLPAVGGGCTGQCMGLRLGMADTRVELKLNPYFSQRDYRGVNTEILNQIGMSAVRNIDSVILISHIRGTL